MSNMLCFDSFEIDLEAGEVRKAGSPIRIREQSFQVLACLLEHSGQLVSRDQLRDCLWHTDVFVDFDNGLNAAVARLRAALGDCADRPRFIETVPRRGYRFLVDVRPAGPSSDGGSRRLVVLRFAHAGRDAADEYFSDVVSDELITALAGVAARQLAVIARTTAMRYKGSRKDVARIARELNAEFVVEGVVRRSANRLAINVHLIRGSDQTHLYAGRYDAGLDDVREVQDEIARAIVAHIPSRADAARLLNVVPTPSRAA